MLTWGGNLPQTLPILSHLVVCGQQGLRREGRGRGAAGACNAWDGLSLPAATLSPISSSAPCMPCGTQGICTQRISSSHLVLHLPGQQRVTQVLLVVHLQLIGLGLGDRVDDLLQVRVVDVVGAPLLQGERQPAEESAALGEEKIAAQSMGLTGTELNLI